VIATRRKEAAQSPQRPAVSTSYQRPLEASKAPFPTQPEDVPDTSETMAALEAGSAGIFKTLVSVVVGFGVLVGVWMAALASETAPVAWFLGVLGVVLCLFALGQVSRRRRQRLA